MPAANGGRVTSNGTRQCCELEGRSRFVERFSRHRKYRWELKPKRKPLLGLLPLPIRLTNIGTHPLVVDPRGQIRPVQHAVHKNMFRATVSSCTLSSLNLRGQHCGPNWLNLCGKKNVTHLLFAQLLKSNWCPSLFILDFPRKAFTSSDVKRRMSTQTPRG